MREVAKIAAPAPAPMGTALALLPGSMGEAVELAKVLSTVPGLPPEMKALGACLQVIDAAMRWRMSPFAVAAETSFPQGRPMYSGKLVAAAIATNPALRGRLRYRYSGEGDALAVEVSGLLQGEDEPRTVEVRLRDVATRNAMWTKQPMQQLAYSGARVWARRHLPEAILGIWAPEEFDAQPPPPPPQDRRREHAPPPAQQENAGMVIDHELEEEEVTLPPWPLVSRTGMITACANGEDWRRQWSYRITSVERAEYPVPKRLETLDAMARVNAEAFRHVADAGEDDLVADVQRQWEEARARLLEQVVPEEASGGAA